MAPVLLNPHRFTAPSEYATEVLADSPLAYYRLGEASGSTMADSSGNGRNGTYLSPEAQGVTGLLVGDSNTAVRFGGGTGGNRCEVTDAGWMDVGSITIEALVNADTLTSVRSIVDRHYVHVTAHYQFRINAGKLELIFWTTSAGPFAVVGASTLVAGTTYHVAGTYDGTTARVHVNGVSDGSLAQAGSLRIGSTDTLIGNHRSDVSAWSQQWDGVIDEVAIYNSALSSTRLAAHYAAAT